MNNHNFSYDVLNVHKQCIKPGDTILHNGNLLTVCKNDITKSAFMGISLFGDNYKCGYQTVKKVINLRRH
jgi:uncharacterized Zn-binding protein involved in type VI secretion